jgi:hypothetical protein
MTDEERQLLKDTAKNLLILLSKWDDVMSGMGLAIVELYRGEITTPHRKSVTLARLKLQSALLKQKGETSGYLEGLVRDLEKWNGFE